MFNLLYLLPFYFICYLIPLQAINTSLFNSSLSVQGINLLSGENEEINDPHYIYEYQSKKVKRITEKETKNFKAIEFNYFSNYTEVIHNHQIKDVYYFNNKKQIIELQHLSSQQGWNLYRKERLFWNKNNQLVSRVIEDAQGNAHICYLCDFNSQGQLIKETLVGNLSGECQSALIIQKEGTPLNNGIESYSIYYEYDQADPTLLLLKKEDNGLVTHFQYDPSSKHCIAKLRGNSTEFLSRYFYEYDTKGFLHRTIIDDGQSFDRNDDSGVMLRKIMEIQSSHQLMTYGQPLCIENKYFDFNQNQEILLDRMICNYSADGQLESQDFFDALGELKNSEMTNQQTLSDGNDQVQDIYDFDERRLTSTDINSNETDSYYDQFGRLILTLLPSVLNEEDAVYRPSIEQKYNFLDQVSETRENGKNPTLYYYNIRNKPIFIEYADGSFEKFTYYLDGELKEQIGKDGNQTFFYYDKLGRLSSKELFSPTGIKLKELIYTYQGSLKKSISDNHTYTIRYIYDGAGRQISYEYEKADGTIQQDFSYDSTGQIHASDNEKIPHVSAHEQEGSSSLHTTEKLVKNERDQYVKVVETVDANGCKHLTIYDALERPEQEIVYNSIGVKISEIETRHNDKNQKVLERHHRIQQGMSSGTYQIKWTYDLHERLIQIQEGQSTALKKCTSYYYNQIGQLEKIIQPNGICLNYVYDQRGLLVFLKSSDDTIDYAYEYDDLYRLIRVEDQVKNNCQTLTYTGFNQLLQVSNDHLAIHYNYDELGRCALLTLPDQTSIRYHYHDTHMHKIERLDKDQTLLYSHQYEYDSETHLLVTDILMNNLGTVDYKYDSHGKKSAVKSQWWSQINEKDSAGRILKIQINDLKGSDEQSFVYDSQGQLSQDYANKYQYDSLFNCVSTNKQTRKINELNQLLSSTDFAYIYDINGNLIEKNNSQESHFYTYDALNRLTRYENNQKNAVEYSYDTFNRRISENNFEWCSEASSWIPQQTFHYLYDGLHEIGKMDVSGNMIELRVLGSTNKAEIGAAIAIELQGEVFAPIHDMSGSVRCLINPIDQSVHEFYRYSTFGEQEIYDSQGSRIDSKMSRNPWRYFSKRYDEISQLTFFGLRYYDASIGRWTTPDPTFFSDNPNLYAFVKNDPLNHYDLQGLFSISSLWNSGKKMLSSCYQHFKTASSKFKEKAKAHFQLPKMVTDSFEKISQKFLCECIHLLLGYQSSHSHNGTYGEREVEKVRITFINGILSTDSMLQENLDLISQSHGGIKIHYVFRGTRGWIGDISRAIIMRMGYIAGYRSYYAHHLAEVWRELIAEMGGVDGGGMIIHYAHSLGGCDTDRARTLLTPEEQKMIRVFTFGSATLVRNIGFESVINIVSANDLVSSIILEPLGRIRNYFDPNTNVKVYGTFSITWWMSDHLLMGITYKSILQHMGQSFVNEFLI